MRVITRRIANAAHTEKLVPVLAHLDDDGQPGVAVRTYDGDAALRKSTTSKGAVTGIVPDRPGSGTYQVNEDCTAIALFQPGPGITIEERMVIVERGNELKSISSSPPPHHDQRRAHEN